MNAAEITRRLNEIAASQHPDPDLDAAVSRRDQLHQQRDVLTGQRTVAQQQLDELELKIETSLLAGTPIDDRLLAKAQDAIRGLDGRLPMHTRALTEATRRVTELELARAVRTEALLRPLFVELIAQLDAQAAAVAATEELLARAHGVANNAIPSASSSPLVNGYCLFAPAERLTWWRERVIRAGLLPKKQRVA